MFELPTVVERFATDFDELSEIVPGVGSARLVIASGLMVRFFVAYGLLVDDGAVDLIVIV